MRRIIKVEAPKSLKRFRRKHPGKNYNHLVGQEHASIRRDIRKNCLKEQYYLCAYCCVSLHTINDCHNEHIIPKNTPEGANKSLDFNNIVASCNSNRHCGHYKKNKNLPISPLDIECETAFEYQLSGQINGKSENAKETLKVLNLNYNGLIHQRKELIDTFIYTWSDDFNELNLEEKDFLKEVVDEYKGQEIEKMDGFFPIIQNFIHNYYNLTT